MKRFLHVFTMAALIFTAMPSLLYAAGEEKVFAGYFDIACNSPAGTEVTGRIHLERNKDVKNSPIPAGYHFEILCQKDGMFRIETCYDPSKRIMGVLYVADGHKTEIRETSHNLTIALKDGRNLLKKFAISVKVKDKTLWKELQLRYMATAIGNSRMYGRTKYSDEDLAGLIVELRDNNWMFKGLERCYSFKPQSYLATKGLTIDYDWETVVNQIGGLGYSYAKSKTYGPEGDPMKHDELREVLFNTLLTYIKAVTIDGSDVKIKGEAIGECTGDGISLLSAHKMANHKTLTHQWILTDGLIVPILYLMPDVEKGIRNNDGACIEMHDALIRYFQLFFSEVKSRRAIDDPDGRWGEIRDTLHSAGAWADANLGHRMRTMLALPIIWADYNRPVTYVQYWYSDYYKEPPFEGFSFSPGWSPHGVVEDVSHWLTKFEIEAHKYGQSGFHPDGTVSHHTGQATDAAMVAYGFEWLTGINDGFAYFKGTDFELDDSFLKFETDRLLRVYPKLFYKQRMDFLVAGRSFLDDMQKFVKKQYLDAADQVIAMTKDNTRKNSLSEISRQIRDNSFEYSGSEAFWVNEFLVHRRGKNEAPFYASLKLKSERTVGAEDFSRDYRSSWHLGYGILQVKADGDEYSDNVLCNYDWHAIPGLTEEWRTDILPLGHSQASLPGMNKIAGVLADGVDGMGIYHHFPGETYSSATAFKTYHFIDDKIIALGSGVSRIRPGQGEEITTFIEQTAFDGPLTICTGGKPKVIKPGQSVRISEEISGVCWLQHGKKGYVILPLKKISLRLRTGKEIKIHNLRISTGEPNFIIALGHGAEPGQENDNAFRYIQLTNVSAKEMPERVEALLNELEFEMKEKSVHSVFSAQSKTRQYAFFEPGSGCAGGIRVKSEEAAQLMLREDGDCWVLTVQNPMPDADKSNMTFETSLRLTPGVYTYTTKGIYPMEGETVTVNDCEEGSIVRIELPDRRNEEKYNYQSGLYSAMPITVRIPGQASGQIHLLN